MKITIADDLCPQNRIEQLIPKEQYGAIFDSIRPTINFADYAIFNLVCPAIPKFIRIKNALA